MEEMEFQRQAKEAEREEIMSSIANHKDRAANALKKEIERLENQEHLKPTKPFQEMDGILIGQDQANPPSRVSKDFSTLDRVLEVEEIMVGMEQQIKSLKEENERLKKQCETLAQLDQTIIEGVLEKLKSRIKLLEKENARLTK